MASLIFSVRMTTKVDPRAERVIVRIINFIIIMKGGIIIDITHSYIIKSIFQNMIY